MTPSLTCRYGQARRRGRMISAKVDFLQLLVVKASVGRLAVGERCNPEQCVELQICCAELHHVVLCCAVLCRAVLCCAVPCWRSQVACCTVGHNLTGISCEALQYMLFLDVHTVQPQKAHFMLLEVAYNQKSGRGALVSIAEISLTWPNYAV